MNSNSTKTFLLLLLMTIFFLIIGELIGGRSGMTYAFFFAIAMNFFSYWFSDKIVLSMYNAMPVLPEKEPKLYEMVSALATNAQIPTPKIYYIKSPMPNAFATGRDPQHAVVAITEGLVQLLDDNELRGVISHEMSHIKNRDILISCIASVLAGAIMILVRFGFWFGGDRNRNNGGIIIALLLMIFAPVAAMLIQMAISRSREYIADADGAKISNDPLALASALRKLSEGNLKMKNDVNPQTAHMFIVNPLRSGGLENMFSTHPPIQERIKRLEEMANLNNTEQYNIPKVIY
jgi:heat shock protein HtpX